MVADEARVCFFAQGTRGDVQPLAALAAALSARRPAATVAIATHTQHQAWLGGVVRGRVSFRWLSAAPVREACVGDNAHRQECISIAESILDVKVNQHGTQAAEGQALVGQRAIVFNLFCLEAYHIAEALGVPCIAASPYIVPYKMPERLRRALEVEREDLGVGTREIDHWMWPLFTERWGDWRQTRLGLPRFPHHPASLLYGFSPNVVPRPGWWPASVSVCGFWYPPRVNRCPSPADSACDEARLRRWIAGCEGAPILCVDFGSSFSLGLIPGVDWLAKVCLLGVQELGWCVPC
eukprot:evm.model.scf_1228.2 EVM.evm.TU.scf_1228.2   scf_1228:18346-22669(-)